MPSGLRRIGALASIGVFGLAVLLGLATSLHNDGRLPRIDIVPEPQLRELEARGDWQRVASELEASLRFGVGPRRRPAVLARLGAALSQLGRSEAAIARFQEALTLRPDSSEIRRRLVNELQRVGRLDESAAETRRLLADSPDDLELITHLADTLERLGDRDAAIAELRRAVALRPDDPVLQNNLAWLLATHPDAASRRPDEALALASASAERRPDDVALDTLASALAAAGRFDEAARTAERAEALARREGRARRAEAIARRAQHYRAGRLPASPGDEPSSR